MYEEIEGVYIKYYGQLYGYIMKIGGNEEIIDDVIQNTFLQALKSIETFNRKSSIKTWLFSIAKYELYAYFRKRKIHISIDEAEELKIGQNINYEDIVISNNILEHMKGMKPPLDEIMKLRLVYGMSFREIGKMVGKTENYCRVNFYRIKEKIRKEYKYE